MFATESGEQMLQREGRKKSGSMASYYTGLIGESVHGSGQGRTENRRLGVVGRSTWCRCTTDHLHHGKHAD